MRRFGTVIWAWVGLLWVLVGASLPCAAAGAPTHASAGASEGVDARGNAQAVSAPIVQAAAASEPAVLRILSREVVVLRADLAGASPQARVARTRERLRALPESAAYATLNVVPYSLGQARGVQFLLGNEVLFSLLEADLDASEGIGFPALVERTRVRLEEVRLAWHQTRDRPLLLRGLLKAGAASLALVLAVVGLAQATRRGLAWLERTRGRLAGRRGRIDWREFTARLVIGFMKLLQWLILLLMGYAWLRFVLGCFVATEPLSRQLAGWLWGKLAWVGDGLLGAIPGLASIVIVVVVTRAIVDVLGYFFDAVQQGRVRVAMLHPETIPATRRIVTLLAWGFGVAIAYPYLPGSSSDAFKGLSVLFGLMLTLGSTGIVTQAMSGLVVVYSRALRKGDFIQVNGVEGVVTEVASLATKVVNVRNEEITIPHSVLIGHPIHNYSRQAGQQGTLIATRVSIGYDTAWRQVHAMLIAAASRTEGVRDSPQPFVLQRELSDFYVEYELLASIDQPFRRVAILSALHAEIQDEFTAHGVQIMSPHFLAQPEEPVIVPKSRWSPPPASG